MIIFILNVKVLTTETGLDKPMYDALNHFEPKEVEYNINVYKYIAEDVNEDLIEDEFVSEDVNVSGVINDDIADEISVLENSLKKKKRLLLKL